MKKLLFLFLFFLSVLAKGNYKLVDNYLYIYEQIAGSNYPATKETRSPFCLFYDRGNLKSGEMKEIKLSQQGKNKGLFVAIVDDEDFEYLNRFKWYASKCDNAYYVCRKLNKKMVYMHRVIMNTPIGFEIDHIDHNGLNNQKVNLRNCTRKQNAINRKPYGKLNYIGVWIKRKNFAASICVNNKTIHLGTYKTPKDAALARDKASIKYFGEFANLNFKT